MGYSLVYGRASAGLEAPEVRVETHLSAGIPAFNIVGLPEAAVRESKDRVRSALLNSRLDFPDQRITVNLAPADLSKAGGRFDLPIALGILVASGQLPEASTASLEFAAELSLNGELCPVRAALPLCIAARQRGRGVVLAPANAALAAHVPDADVRTAPDLLTLCGQLRGRHPWPGVRPAPLKQPAAAPDLADVMGQSAARRALEIAAAGGHHLLMIGPPGTGKTLLASRLAGILPSPQRDRQLELLALASLRDSHPERLPGRPFRSPHHSATAAALIGGGQPPEPGEISLAHGGVLFLDELPEFPRATLDMLREPLEAGEIRLARARGRVCYPARFQLIAAMNPCPCGYLGDPRHECRCSPDQIARYGRRVSGPLLDRIDLQVAVTRPDRLPIATGATPSPERSDAVRARVDAAWQRQLERQGCANAELPAMGLAARCAVEEAARIMLGRAAEHLGLSLRSVERSLRVARTIADLAPSGPVTEAHVAEALAYRVATAGTAQSPV